MFGGLELLLPLIPLVIWMYLRTKQGKLINGLVKEMGELGRIYFGQDDDRKPKVMILVAADRKGVIADAKFIKLLRYFKPASMFDLPEIIGKKIGDLTPSKLTNDVDIRYAIKNLKFNFDNMRHEKGAKIRKKVKSKRVVSRNSAP
jgi:hypothetical protein